MKIIYFDMTRFFVSKRFYDNKDYQLRNRLFDVYVDFGRKNEYLE